MFLARIVTVLGVVAALGLTALPASADQGRGRGSSQRGAVRAPRAGHAPPPAYRGSYRVYPAPRYYGIAPRYYGPRVVFPRPYYAFRPRVSIGLGIWAGFPVPFPAWAYASPYPAPAYPAYPAGYPAPYPYPVPYPAPYPAPYPSPYQTPSGATGSAAQAPAGQVAVTPGTEAYGGVSLDITPADAEIYVDGGYAGPAGDFGPQAQPLTLAVGVHRIEVRAPGYRTLVFDVTISSGYVVPYQGVLQPGL